MSQEYYNTNAISNSMLSAFEKDIFNIQTYGNLEKAFEFGRVTHQLILEPQKPLFFNSDFLNESDIQNIKIARQRLKNEPFFKWVKQFSQKEKEIYWTEKTTGLKCKSKLDILYKSSIVVDLKTTSAKSEKEFRKSIKAFSYERQAAFYADSVGAKRFIFVAIQKAEPNNIYTVELSKNELDEGREKYTKLLQLAKKLNYFNINRNYYESVNPKQLFI